jgi:hypothetical protein
MRNFLVRVAAKVVAAKAMMDFYATDSGHEAEQHQSESVGARYVLCCSASF